MRAKRVKEIRKFTKMFSKSNSDTVEVKLPTSRPKNHTSGIQTRLKQDSLKFFVKGIKKILRKTPRFLRPNVVPAMMMDILLKTNKIPETTL